MDEERRDAQSVFGVVGSVFFCNNVVFCFVLFYKGAGESLPR